MKLKQLVERLLQFDQDLDVEIICPDQLELGSVYDNTDPLYNRPEDVRKIATLVTIELDAARGV